MGIAAQVTCMLWQLCATAAAVAMVALHQGDVCHCFSTAHLHTTPGMVTPVFCGWCVSCGLGVTCLCTPAGVQVLKCCANMH